MLAYDENMIGPQLIFCFFFFALYSLYVFDSVRASLEHNIMKMPIVKNNLSN